MPPEVVFSGVFLLFWFSLAHRSDHHAQGFASCPEAAWLFNIKINAYYKAICPVSVK